MNVFWNRDERRVRALWRLVAQATLLGAVAFAPTIALIEFLAGAHKAGAFLPGLGAGLFDKTMDFIAGPLLTILIVASVAIAGRFIDRRRWRDFGLYFNRAWRGDLYFGLFLGAALITLVFAAEYTLGWVRIEPRAAPGVSDVPVVYLWVFILLKALCVGTGEELVSRGYQLKNVVEGLNGVLGLSPAGAAMAAALVTSLAFSALHLTTDNFSTASLIGLFINGLLLAAPVLLTGRLGISIGLHMAWNITQGGVFGYPVSGDVENISLMTAHVTGPGAWTGGAYGPEAGYLGWLAMAAGIVAIAVWVRARTGSAKILPAIAKFTHR